MRNNLVIGIDSGGTSTRCVIASTDGTILARGAAGGANPRSNAGRPADSLTVALRAALSELATRQRSGVQPAWIAYGVVGAAGAGAAGRDAAREATKQAWRAVGLTAEVITVTDLEVAFAAGTAAPSGLLLLSGTGAAAAFCRDGVVTHRCDGYGWLLGDEGSAVWIGREGLRRVLAALDGRGPATALIDPVTALLTAAQAPPAPVPFSAVAEARAQALLAAAYAMPPAALGRIAPLVSEAAAAGDPVASEITKDAVDRLLHALLTVCRPSAGTDGGTGGAGGCPVVFAGSVLLTPGPVADGVRTGVRERLGVEPSNAHEGAAGAAAIAITRLRGCPVPADVHARLTGPPRS